MWQLLAICLLGLDDRYNNYRGKMDTKKPSSNATAIVLSMN